MKHKLILFSIIFLLNFTSAITIQENTQFKPSATTTTFIFGNNLTFSSVEVYSTYLKLDNNTISANSSVGNVNITIFNFTDSYKKFNETKSNPSATVSYIISNFSSGASILATKNNIAWTSLTGNSTGYISFDYTGSSALFEVELGVMPTVAETAEESSSGGGGYPTYKPTSEELEKGYEQSLRKNYKMKFEVNNESHELKVDDVGDERVTITVSSEVVTFDLNVGETKKLDLDSDGFYNLEVFLKSVSGFSYWKKANLVVRVISEEVVVDEIIEEKKMVEDVIVEEFNYLWSCIVLGLVVVLVITLSIRQRKRT